MHAVGCNVVWDLEAPPQQPPLPPPAPPPTTSALQVTVINDLPPEYPDVSNGMSIHWHGWSMQGGWTVGGEVKTWAGA